MNTQTSGSIIRPASYRPPGSEDTPQRPRISPWHVVLSVVLAGVLLVMWYLFTARAVQIVFVPQAGSAGIEGGFSFTLGDVYLLRPGDYTVVATADGYQALRATLNVGDARNQRHTFEFVPLPGQVSISTTPPGTQVALVDSHGGITIIGETPIDRADVPAGEQRLRFSHPRYQTHTATFNITGRRIEQSFSLDLLPNWGEVEIATSPEGVSILVDGEDTGQVTPAVVEVLAGEHEITLRKPGFRGVAQRLVIAAMERETLQPITLTQADAGLSVTTTPAGAGITVNGQFMGTSPLDLELKSGTGYRVEAFLQGYSRKRSETTLSPGDTQSMHLDLTRQLGEVVVTVEPAGAQLKVNGVLQHERRLSLPTQAHRIELSLPGYAGYTTSITPKFGLTQEVKVRLLTVEEARLAALKPEYTNSAGMQLRLFSPDKIQLGASRREPGQRANETLREATLTRLFYAGLHEVTNAQFRQFASGHDSQTFEEHALNGDDQPVVNIGWNDAALFCNWLSDQEGLAPFYTVEFSQVKGFNPASAGYRLLTEAEWSWLAQTAPDGEKPWRFPWGNQMPPGDRQGNYADRAAAHVVGRVIFGYNDNHIVAAPVGSFPADRRGLFDMGGNVAEWTHDFYEIPSAEPVTDPTGPASGEYHVIKGASWMHGTISDLRLAYRDYGIDGRSDLGFRIGRYAE